MRRLQREKKNETRGVCLPATRRTDPHGHAHVKSSLTFIAMIPFVSRFVWVCSVEQGEVEDHFVLRFKGDAENVLVTEAEALVHMVAYPDVLTDLTVSSGRIEISPGGGRRF